MSKLKPDSKKYISDVLAIPVEQILDEHVKYYYTKYPQWCCDIQPKVMLENIEPYKFLEPIEELSEFSSYHKDLLKRLKKINMKKIVPSADTDEMILQYIKCREQIKIVTLFENQKISGDIYYEKEIELDKKSVVNLLYQLYAHTDKIYDYKKLSEMADKVNNKTIKVVVLENMKGDVKGEHHITRTFIEAVEIGQLYFCQNSIEFLKMQILDRHMAIYMKSCRFKINTFKKWMMENIYLLDQMRFLTYSSSILYAYGLRRCNDFDEYFHWTPMDYATPDFINKINKYFFDDNTRFPFIDLAMKGQGKWVKDGAMAHWDKWFLEDLPQMVGAKDAEQVIYDPKYHFYFMGLKCMTLELDIKKRLDRSRPASIANVIATSKLLNMGINIPDVPRFYYKMQGVVEKIDTPEKEQAFLHTIKCRLKQNYRIDLSYDDIRKLFIFSNATNNVTANFKNEENNKKTNIKDGNNSKKDDIKEGNNSKKTDIKDENNCKKTDIKDENNDKNDDNIKITTKKVVSKTKKIKIIKPVEETKTLSKKLATTKKIKIIK